MLFVFGSEADDGLNSHPANPLAIADPVVFFGGEALIHVYLDNGGTLAAGPERCGPSSAGDEFCQAAVGFDTTGNLKIVDIAWADPAVQEDDEPTAPAVARRGTWGDALFGNLGPTKIASVKVVGTKGELLLTTPPGFGVVLSDGSVLTVEDLAPGEVGLVLARAGTVPWTRFDAMGTDVCGVLGTGEVLCWGSGFAGSPPTTDVYHSVATTETGACALETDGDLVCWGDVGTPLIGPKYLQIASGFDGHFCVLQEDLEINCWKGTTHGDDPIEGTMMDPIPAGPFREVSRGGLFACARRLDDTVVCWGDDTFGQVSGAPAGAFAGLAGGEFHACALATPNLVDPDNVVCWGDGSAGQTADPIAGTYVDISSGEGHNCATRDDDHTVHCWGSDSGGQTSGAPVGVQFADLSVADELSCGIRLVGGGIECWGTGVGGSEIAPEVAFPQVGAGGSHSCQSGTDGTLSCWGDDTSGKVSGAPAGIYSHLKLGRDFGCALASGTGIVSCWGDDPAGTPVVPLTSLATGVTHACGTLSNAFVTCWGDDTAGKSTPPFDLGSVLGLAVGDLHSCALKVDMSIECWGESGANRTSAPAGTWVELGARTDHSCARDVFGGVVCWGRGDAPDPGLYLDPPLAIFAQTSVGGTHSCAGLADGSYECWGEDDFGQSSSPTIQLASLSSGHSGHNCGPSTQGALGCWGRVAPLTQSQPPKDSDADGLEDPIDNCEATDNGPIAGTCIDDTSGLAVLGSACTSDTDCTGGSCSNDQEDSDGDGAGDACDNCLASNADQFDQDADGIGNSCDNCPATANGPLAGTCITLVGSVVQGSSCTLDSECTGNAGSDTCLLLQVDADGNGIGDICEGLEIFDLAVEAVVSLTGGSSSSSLFSVAAAEPTSDLAHHELRIRCPQDFKVSRARLAVRLPAGSGTPRFATESTDPTAACYGSDLTCVGATLLGETVDPLESFAVLGSTVDTSGALDDVVYYSLSGKETFSGSGDRRLCPDGAEEQLLALIVVDVAVEGEDGTPTTNGVDQVTDFGTDTASFLDNNDEEVQSTQWTYVIGPGSANVKISVSPAVGFDDSNATDWLVKLETRLEFERVTIAVDANGLDETEVEFLGCTNQVSGSAVRCAAGPELGPWVDPSLSWTEGPDSFSGSTNFYVSLAGALDAEFPVNATYQTLLHVPNAPLPAKVQLGTIRIPSRPGIRPAFEGKLSLAAGIADLALFGDGTTPYLLPNEVNHDAADSQLIGSGLPSTDADVDGLAKDTDLCPFIPDPTNLDDGKLGETGMLNAGAGADGFGTFCQCGDGMDDEFDLGLSDADVGALQGALLDPTETANADIVKQCSVSASTDLAGETVEDCNIKDVVILKLSLEPGGATAPSQTCKKARLLNGGDQSS